MSMLAIVLWASFPESVSGQGLPPIEILIQEEITVTDTTSTLMPIELLVQESVQVTAAVLISPPIEIIVQETVTVDDSVRDLSGIGLAPIEIIVHETVTVDDSVRELSGIGPGPVVILVQESVVVRDSPNVPAGDGIPAPLDPGVMPITIPAFIGDVTTVEKNFILVAAGGNKIRVLLTPETVIHSPPDENVGIGGLLTDPPSRVVVFADGIPVNGRVTGEKITIIPAKATRQHKRVVITEKSGNGILKLLDSRDQEFNVGGAVRDDIKIGDSLIVILQFGGKSGDYPKIKGFVKPIDIDKRLEKFLKREPGKSRKAGKLSKLRIQVDLAEQKRLMDTAKNATGDKLVLVQNTVALHRKMMSGKIPGTGRDGQLGGPVTVSVNLKTEQVIVTSNASSNTEPIIVTGNIRLNNDGSPLVEFNSPTGGVEITQGRTLLIKMQTTGDIQVESLEFTVNGVVVETTTDLAGYTGLEFPVPDGIELITIQPIATAGGKQFTFDSLSLKVKEDPPPTVEILQPAEGFEVKPGQIVFEVRANDNSNVTSVLGVLSVDDEPIKLVFRNTGTVDIPQMNWRAVGSVPARSYSVNLEVTVTDNLGNTATATRNFEVVVDPPPTVKILEPSDRVAWKVEEGETFLIRIKAEDNGQVRSVDVVINGEPHSATLRNGEWIYQATAPKGSPLSNKKSTSAPPHVFVGTAFIGEKAAPDGTVVTAWISATPDSTLSVVVQATDDQSGIAVASQEIQVVGKSVQVSEATVRDGGYSLLVHAREGHVFSGLVISFRVGDTLAKQTAKWQQGGGDEVNLVFTP